MRAKRSVRRAVRYVWQSVRVALRFLADLPSILCIMAKEAVRYGPRVTALYVRDHVERVVRGAPPERYSRITDGLHVGGQYTERGWRELQRRGVTAVISLRDEFDNAEVDLAPDRYLYLPTVDNTPPTLLHLAQGVRYLHQEIRAGGQVYVHCMLGVGRSATLAAAYFVRLGATPTEAWQQVRRRRPFIQPTPSQRVRLEEFALVAPGVRLEEAQPVVGAPVGQR